MNLSWIRNIPRLHSTPILGSNPGGGSDPSYGVSLTRVYTVILLTEQTPQVGQFLNKLNFALLHMEKLYTLRGQTRLSVYKKKSGVRPRMLGRTLQIWRSTNGGSDPAIRAGDLRLHWGAKGKRNHHSGIKTTTKPLKPRTVRDKNVQLYWFSVKCVWFCQNLQFQLQCHPAFKMS